MLELLLSADRQILFLVNGLPHNPITNNFFLFFSVAGSYGLLWFLLVLILFLFDGLDNRRELISLTISGILVFIIVEVVLKNIFLRIRPESALEAEILLVMARSSSFSFPSGHATIAFSAAYILTRQRKHLAWFFYLLAFFVAISRVYLGRHYPSDIIAGAIVGIAVGFYSLKIAEKIFPLLFNKKKPRKNGSKK